MTGDSPLKAHAPNQPFLHALREGDAPPDARTTAAAIPTPSPLDSPCQRHRLHARLQFILAANDVTNQSEFGTDSAQESQNRSSLKCCMTEPVTIQYRGIQVMTQYDYLAVSGPNAGRTAAHASGVGVVPARARARN